MKKRMLSLLLVLTMMVSLLPAPAYAEELNSTDTEISEEETAAGTPEESAAEVAEEEAAADEAVPEEEPEAEPEMSEEPAQETAQEEQPEEPAAETVPEEQAEEPEEESEEDEEMPDIFDNDVTAAAASITGLADSDTLFADYAERVFAAAGDVDSESAMNSITAAGKSLTGNNRIIYDSLKSQIEDVANGKTSSTLFKVPLSALGLDGSYSASELGVSAIVSDGAYTADARNAMNAKLSYDASAIVAALIDDCPYEFYWTDRSYVSYSGLPQTAKKESGEYKAYFNTEYLYFLFGVSLDYCKTETTISPYNSATNIYTGYYTIDQTMTSAVTTAAANAKQIVDSASGLSDYEKLETYKNAICERNVYNKEAGNLGSDEYGSMSPWQLIWVFDGDDSTNVVCEGYSKAFTYLCELSTFNDTGLRCYSVTGTAGSGSSSGAHRWNIVHYGGKNYHVDVTWCDSGWNTFMIGADNGGSFSDTYTYTDRGSTASYTYDANTLALYSEDDLTIAPANDTSGACGDDLTIAPANDTSGVCGDDLTWILTQNNSSDSDPTYTLTISGTGAMTNWSSSTYVPWYSYRESITEVGLPAGLTSIGKWAFAYCTSLKDITLPDKVTSIGSRAFNASGLTGITLPDSVTSIGISAFDSCMGLTSIVIPSGVTSIGSDAFYACENLTSIEIPCAAIGKSAFEGCNSLSTVKFTGNAPEIAGDAFWALPLTAYYPAYDSTWTSDVMQNYGGTITWESYHDHTLTATAAKAASCTEAGNIAYWHCAVCGKYFSDEACSTEIKESSLAIAALGHSYGDYTYRGNGMETATCSRCGAEDTRAREAAASGTCGDKLDWTLIQNNSGSTPTYTLTITGSGAMTEFPNAEAPWYSYAASITEVSLPSGMTSIGSYAFQNCSALTSVVIPDGVTSIGGGAFANCTSLTSVTVPASAVSIGELVFFECPGLKTAGPIGSGCNYEFGWTDTIPAYAFYEACYITSVAVPDSVTSFGKHAFCNCERLESINIPSNLTSIGEYALSGCFVLTDIALPSTLTEIGSNAFSSDYCLTKITIPDGITTIPTEAFDGCSKLENVVIPDSVTTIGQSAFSDCKVLTSITLPPKLTSIGSRAFLHCTSVSTITFKGSAPTIGLLAFSQITAKAYYPAYDSAWTSDIMQQYGGTLTWESYHDHTLTATPAKAATCTEAGSKAYWYCSVCGKYFSDEECKTEMDEDSWVIPALGHSLTAAAASASTCTTHGNIAYWYCTNCHKYFSDEACTAEMEENGWELPLAEHTPVAVPAIIAYSGRSGRTAGTQCSVCGKILSGMLSLSVSYDEPIRCGTETVFTMKPSGGSGNYEYRLYSVTDGEFDVYDVSYGGNNSPYQTADTYSFTFYASGTYYIRFSIRDASTNEYTSTCAYPLVISDPDFPSVDEIVAAAAAECEANCSTDFEKALWLHDWLIDRGDYDYSYSYCAAEGVLARGKGTCESHHRAYVKLLNAVGIESGRITGNGHVWTAVKMDGEWYQVDITGDDVNYSQKWYTHLYFGLTDKLIGMAQTDHTTATAGYESDSLADNYFIRTGEISQWSDSVLADVRSHLANGETEFTVAISDTMPPSTKSIIYSLVAYQVEQTVKSEDQVMLTASYADDTITCSVSIPTPVLKSASLGADGVVVKWNAVNGAASYNLYRKTTGGSWTKIKAGITTASYTDQTALTTGTTYYYSVSTVENGAESAYDMTGVSVKYVAAPTLTSAVQSSSKVTVKWSAVSGATKYAVYRKTAGGSWTRLDTSTTESYTDSTAKTAGTKYYYTVRAYVGAWGCYNNTGIALTYLGAPTLTSAAMGSSGITVKWSKVTGAAGYNVYRKTGSTGSWSQIGTTTTAVTYTDKTALTSGTTYYYTVRVTNGSSISGYDNVGVSAVYLSTPNLSSAANGANGVVVKWSKVTGAKSYTVYRKVSGGSWTKLGTSTTTSYTDKTSLKTGTTYYYTVRATSGSSLSGYNTTGVSVKYIAAPTLKSAAKSGTKITVKWSAVSGATSYAVYRKTAGGSWTKLGTSTTTSYVDSTTKKSGTTYYYTVRAYVGTWGCYNNTGVSVKY